MLKPCHEKQKPHKLLQSKSKFKSSIELHFERQNPFPQKERNLNCNLVTDKQYKHDSDPRTQTIKDTIPHRWSHWPMTWGNSWLMTLLTFQTCHRLLCHHLASVTPDNHAMTKHAQPFENSIIPHENLEEYDRVYQHAFPHVEAAECTEANAGAMTKNCATAPAELAPSASSSLWNENSLCSEWSRRIRF